MALDKLFVIVGNACHRSAIRSKKKIAANKIFLAEKAKDFTGQNIVVLASEEYCLENNIQADDIRSLLRKNNKVLNLQMIA